MPKKIQHTTKATLISVPLPNHAATYTVISHQFIIDYAYQALANAGFGIVDEEYRCTADGQIAQGIYKLNFNNDPELSMMFAWTNSYNKQVKFKCVIGAYINNSGSVMISGEVGSWVRKHTGNADTETKATIDDYITNAHMYYTQLCSDKAAMEVVTLNRRKQSQLLGVLFAEYEILTTEQASMIRDQMKRPQQVFANTDSLWAFYNYVTNALQSSHPKTWMEDQRILHYFIGTICDFSQPVQSVNIPVQSLNDISVEEEEVIDPNQINLLDAIEEAESLAVQHPVTPEEAFEPEVLSEEELAHELYGVDNNNIEVSLNSNSDLETGSDFDIDKEEIQQENLTDVFPQEEPNAEELNEDTVESVTVTESIEDPDKDVFAEADNFDLDFTEETNEDQDDSIPDFF